MRRRPMRSAEVVIQSETHDVAEESEAEEEADSALAEAQGVQVQRQRDRDETVGEDAQDARREQEQDVSFVEMRFNIAVRIACVRDSRSVRPAGSCRSGPPSCSLRSADGGLPSAPPLRKQVSIKGRSTSDGQARIVGVACSACGTATDHVLAAFRGPASTAARRPCSSSTGVGGQPGNDDVHRDDVGHPAERGVAGAEDSAVAPAIADRHDQFRTRCRGIRPPQRDLHVEGDRPGHEQQVGEARRSGEVDAEALAVVEAGC